MCGTFLTGLFFTLLSGWFDCARLLLNEYKADPDLKNKENLTALDVILSELTSSCLKTDAKKDGISPWFVWIFLLKTRTLQLGQMINKRRRPDLKHIHKLLGAT